MLNLGEKQELEIVKKVEFGVYLAENKETALEGINALKVLNTFKS